MPSIMLGEKEFPLRGTPPKHGALMAVSAAERSKDPERMLAAFYRLLVSLVDPSVDVRDIDDALFDMDADEFAAALEEAAKTFTADPTSAVPETSSDSSTGSTDGTPSHRVVSFSGRAAS